MLELLPIIASGLALSLIVAAAVRGDRLTLVGAGLCLLTVGLYWFQVSRKSTELEQALRQAEERIAELEARSRGGGAPRH